MSLMGTSYRYEVLKPIQTALKVQNKEIELSDKNEKFDLDMKLERECILRSQWMDSLAEAAERKKKKRESKVKHEDLRMYRKAAIMVRRDALKNLLALENAIYERELRAQGKAIYVERI